ncbi:MAG: lysophospholipid acyltransferase family protein [Acidobacteriaceae bacterium]
MFASLRMFFVWVFFGLPAAVVGIPWSLLRGNIRAMYGCAMFAMRAGIRAGGIQVRIEGAEHIPRGESCIFLSNHVSNLDPPILLPAIPGMCSVMLKKSLMKIPLVGTAMRMAKFVPVSRGHSKVEAERSVILAGEALRSGLHIFIFPEGTRSHDGNLLPFKKGAFFLAAETNAPMVPIVIRGTAEMMRKGSTKLYPGVATVCFLAPLRPTDFDSREALMDAVRLEMQSALAER